MLTMLKPPAKGGVGDQEFREALKHFASGVTIISTLDAAGVAHGMTATAFSSLSLDPPLVLVAVARNTRCHRQVLADRQFGVSILHAHQSDLSRHFGGRPNASTHPTFKRLAGVPVLEEAMVTMACSLDKVVEGGDHSLFFGLVTASETEGGSPLIHYQGRYHALSKDKI